MNSELKRRLAMQAMMERAAQEQTSEEEHSFRKLNASELYCPNCKQAMPVKEKPLLYLSDGQLFDYLCARCGTSLGTRKE